ncbi:MAG: hypothetical protein IJX11_09030 [Bacteroidales bacterium]|nr:hypothetical protein [Bacteroidales bacterium]
MAGSVVQIDVRQEHGYQAGSGDTYFLSLFMGVLLVSFSEMRMPPAKQKAIVKK